MKPSKTGVMKLSESNKTTHPEGNMGIGHKVATATSIFEQALHQIQEKVAWIAVGLAKARSYIVDNISQALQNLIVGALYE